MTLKLKIITASTRPGRVGPTVSDWAVKVAKENEKFDVELVDLAEINLPLLDEKHHPMMQKYEHDHTKRWSSVIAGADAVIFVTPEYDYFPPASLINAVQVLSREWKYLPIGVVSYGGVSGGLRSAQEVRQLLGNVGAYAIQQTMPIPFFPQFIDDKGEFTANAKMNEGIAGMVDELAKLAVVLKPLRSV